MLFPLMAIPRHKEWCEEATAFTPKLDIKNCRAVFREACRLDLGQQPSCIASCFDRELVAKPTSRMNRSVDGAEAEAVSLAKQFG